MMVCALPLLLIMEGLCEDAFCITGECGCRFGEWTVPFLLPVVGRMLGRCAVPFICVVGRIEGRFAVPFCPVVVELLFVVELLCAVPLFPLVVGRMDGTFAVPVVVELLVGRCAVPLLPPVVGRMVGRFAVPFVLFLIVGVFDAGPINVGWMLASTTGFGARIDPFVSIRVRVGALEIPQQSKKFPLTVGQQSPARPEQAACAAQLASWVVAGARDGV
jgi:hypothetical protein